VAYDTLAAVYEFTLPDALLSPTGSVAAFAPVTSELAPGAAVLDCACGIGLLPVGLAQLGCDVVATDASPAMVERTRALAARAAVGLQAEVCAWEDLAARGWAARFDAVFCVGNSLTHAAGGDARRRALRSMAGVLRAGGLLVLTSRNWELLLDPPPGIAVAERVLERDGRRGLVIRDWHVPDTWAARHRLDVAVALLSPEGDAVETHAELLHFWPFTYAELREELEAAGLRLETSTFAADVERYMVTARAPGR
jgi:SAM-dependent methyltransferase